jgi:predicted deacylase
MGFFPKNYDDAVAKFRTITSGFGGEAGVWNVGQGLDIDHRYWPALKERSTLFFLMSGVHGPETYAGHAIQAMFLNEIFPKIKRDRCGVFMVHALNPYGFKHNRRGTESGVNLNRNCSILPDLYQIQNQASLNLGLRFVPREPLTSSQSLLLRSMRRAGSEVLFDEVTLDEFIRAVAPGQFATPEGLEFGGFDVEPQIRALIKRLQEILPGYKDVVFLDLHTGLGHRGRLHLLLGDKAGCVDESLMKEILDPKSDHDAYEYTPNNEQGFYPTFGSTNDLLAELVQPPQRLCAFTMEFGTLGHDIDAQLQSLNVWLTEHQGSCYGYANPAIEKQVRAEHIEKFNPSAESWGESVISASRKTLSRVLQRLNHL